MNIAAHQALGNTESMLLTYPGDAEPAPDTPVCLRATGGADPLSGAAGEDTLSAVAGETTLSGTAGCS